MQRNLRVLLLFLVSALLANVASAQKCHSIRQYCSSACVTAAECNNQCAQLTGDALDDCLCQTGCVCAMKLCGDCCVVAPGQKFCHSNAFRNLEHCHSRNVTKGTWSLRRECSAFLGVKPKNFDGTFVSAIESFLAGTPTLSGVTLPTDRCNVTELTILGSATTTATPMVTDTLSYTNLNEGLTFYDSGNVDTATSVLGSLSSEVGSQLASATASSSATSSSATASSGAAPQGKVVESGLLACVAAMAGLILM